MIVLMLYILAGLGFAFLDYDDEPTLPWLSLFFGLTWPVWVLWCLLEAAKNELQFRLEMRRFTQKYGR